MLRWIRRVCHPLAEIEFVSIRSFPNQEHHRGLVFPIRRLWQIAFAQKTDAPESAPAVNQLDETGRCDV